MESLLVKDAVIFLLKFVNYSISIETCHLPDARQAAQSRCRIVTSPAAMGPRHFKSSSLIRHMARIFGDLAERVDT